MPQGSHKPEGAPGVLLVLWEPRSALRLWGAIPKWQQHGCSLLWGWEMLFPFEALPPTVGPVFGWHMGPAFWVSCKRPQELGLALGDIWGNGCHGEGAAEGKPRVLEGLWGRMVQPGRDGGGFSLSPSHL